MIFIETALNLQIKLGRTDWPGVRLKSKFQPSLHRAGCPGHHPPSLETSQSHFINITKTPLLLSSPKKFQGFSELCGRIEKTTKYIHVSYYKSQSHTWSLFFLSRSVLIPAPGGSPGWSVFRSQGLDVSCPISSSQRPSSVGVGTAPDFQHLPSDRSAMCSSGFGWLLGVLCSPVFRAPLCLSGFPTRMPSSCRSCGLQLFVPTHLYLRACGVTLSPCFILNHVLGFLMALQLLSDVWIQDSGSRLSCLHCLPKTHYFFFEALIL